MQLKFKPQTLEAMGGDVRRAEDVYGHQYAVALQPYTGVDFSKKCFVFPGQSAAVPEMGREDYNRHELIQKRFATADMLAKKAGITAPSLYIESPGRVPAEDLSAVQCLALYTMSVALFELLLVNNEKPALLTAHSFGEYAMLVAAGVASFDDMFMVVLERDRACPPAKTVGTMIAISADADTVRKALGSLPVYVANINSPQQTVISVGADAVKQTQDALKKAKLAVKMLESIPQPYHSALLAPAAAKLEQFVRSKKIMFSAPRTPMLSSVTGKVITADNFTSDTAITLIAKQLTAPLDFVKQVQAAAEFGARNFVELAHHKVSTSWIRDTLKDAAPAIVGKITVPPVLQAEDKTVAAAQKAPTRAYDKKLVGLLNKVVSSVTGYSITEISLNNNFQEDLGIDSIKKAQIILSFLESQGEAAGGLQDGVAMSEIKNIEDILAWYMRDKDSAAQGGAVADRSFARFKPVWQPAPITAVDRALMSPAQNYAWVAVQKAGAELPPVLAALTPYDGIVFYDDGSAFSFVDWMRAIHASYVEFRTTDKDFNFVFACSTASTPEVKALDGFVKSMAMELPRRTRIMQFDGFTRATHEAAVLEEASMPFMHTVKVEGGQRYVQTMQLCQPVAATPAPTTVAAIGGTRGVTRALLQGMVPAGTKNVAIMGRRSEASVAADLAELRAAIGDASDVTITYFAGDATKKTDLDAYLKAASNQFGTIDLLINGGGVEFSAFVMQQTEANVIAQTEVKINTTKMLAELADVYPITRISGFASIAGEFGSPGQTVYSYANIAMTYLSDTLNAQLGRPVFTTIAWPAWNRVGMTDNDDTYKQMLLAGVTFLEIPDGQRLFMEELADTTGTRSICIDHGAIAHMAPDAVQPAALDVLFPGVDKLRSPLPLTAWTLRNIPDLKNHMVLEHAVVPMSMSVAMFFYMAYLETGRAYTLNDVKALSFMLLHQKESPYFLDYQHTDSGIRAEMRSNDKHVEAMLQPATAADVASIPAYVEPDASKLMLMDSQYDVHNLGKGDFKEGFGVLSGIRADATGRSYATLNLNPPRMRLGTDPINWLTIVIESLLQLGGVGARVLSRKANAPVMLKKVYVNPQARRTATYKAVCICELLSDDIATGHMTAYNEDGEIFVHIHDAQVRMWGFDEK